MIWKVAEGTRLLWRSWENEYIVFSAGPGDTHLLDRASAQILQRIESHPSSPAELNVWLSSNRATDVGEDRQYLVNVLDRLHALALIESAPS
jgi:PqqD family protein of HPr-rel-A system